MAQPIHCDAHNREHLADVLVSQIANGDTAAFCFAGYIDVCRALVADVEAQAAEVAKVIEAEAIESGAADQAEADAAAAEAAARLGTAPFLAAEPEAQAATGEALAATPGPEPLAVDPAPAVVVRRGTSRSRRAHEARQRAKAATVAPEPMTSNSAAAAPSGEPTDEPGGGEQPA